MIFRLSKWDSLFRFVSCFLKVKEERENETVQIRKEMQNFDFVQNRKVIKNDLEKNESLMKKSFCKKMKEE